MKTNITVLLFIFLFVTINVNAKEMSQIEILNNLKEIKEIKHQNNKKIIDFLRNKISQEAHDLLEKINKKEKTIQVLTKYQIKITRNLVYLNRKKYCIKNKRSKCEEQFQIDIKNNILKMSDLYNNKEILQLNKPKKYDEKEYFLHPRKKKNIIYNKMVFAKDKLKYVKNWGEREIVRLKSDSYIYN